MAILDPEENKTGTCLIITAYNDAGSIAEIIEKSLIYASKIVVIDNASNDETPAILARYKDRISIITNSKNKGKGGAIRQGLEWALNSSFEYGITIMANGHYSPDDIPRFLEQSWLSPESLIIGTRNKNRGGAALTNSFGNKFSNFWFWVATGANVTDTESGFKLYPLNRIKGMKFYTGNYEFEMEAMIRLAWKNTVIESIPVSVNYPPGKKRGAHFRSLMDFLRISLLNLVLIAIAIFYIFPRNFILSLFDPATYHKVKGQLTSSRDSRLVKSLSVGFGLFMGIIPIWGFQLLAALFLSVLFKFNKLMVMLSANLSNPLTFPLIIYLSYKMGALWMNGKHINTFNIHDISYKTIHTNFIQYLYGSISLAILAGVISSLITFVLLSIFSKDSGRSRKD